MLIPTLLGAAVIFTIGWCIGCGLGAANRHDLQAEVQRLRAENQRLINLLRDRDAELQSSWRCIRGLRYGTKSPGEQRTDLN
jgi:hypothetical protein